MKALTGCSALCIGLAVVLASTGAWAEVTVSVTLTGPLDELLPILEHLREMGVGAAPADDDALKLEMHSVATPESAEAPAAPAESAPAEPAPPPPPAGPSFAAFTAEPPVARAGEKVWISILVLNGVGVVDTVAATMEGGQFEFYDNGENGDPVAGDGQWSAEILLDVQHPAGQIPINIVAFDANGQPVKVNDAAGQPVDLATTVTLEVAR